MKHLLVGAMLAGMLVPSVPAHAGDTLTIPDATGDVVDFLKHTQNSFRPSTSPFPSPYTSYQHACRPDSLAQVSNCKPFDLASSRVVTDPIAQTMTFTLTTVGAVPPRGADIAVIPAPFTGARYGWYFGTTAQERPEVAGISCRGVADPDGKIRDNYSVAGTSAGSKVGAEIIYTPTSTCPAAANRDAESKGIGNGLTRPVLSKTNVMTVVHPKTDGWQAFVEVAMAPGANGAKRLDGKGTLVCAGGAALCIDYDLSIGAYEGYSGVSASNSLKDFDSTTQGKVSFSIVGSTVTATIPWNPTVISGIDGDLALDDTRSFPWPLGVAGKNDKITQLTAEVTGLAGVGVNSVPQINAVCPDSTDNLVPDSIEPINTVGRTEGQANRDIANATDDVQDTAGLGRADKDDGIYLHGSGGHDDGDCIRGITGLLTLLDWTDNGFELRIYPRQPAYLPNNVDCRYPIGQRPGAIVLVSNVTLAPISAPVVDVDVSPYDRPYTVNVYQNGATPNPAISGPVLPDPDGSGQNPLGGLIGRDKPCNYTYWAPGLHYFDILPDVAM